MLNFVTNSAREYTVKYKYILPVIVAAAVIFAFVRVLQPVPEPITDATWDAVEKIMAGEAWESEPVIVHPVWEHSAFQRFKTHILSMGKPTSRSLYNYPRIWMVIARGAGDTDYLEETHKLTFDREVGEIRLQRWEKPEVKNLVFDFFSNIRQAKVRLFDSKGKTRACDSFRNLHWTCPIRDWNRVGQSTVQVDGEWQSAVWQHPLAKWTTETRFENVPMDSFLKGEYALADPAIKKLPNGSKVEFRILINDKVVGKFASANKIGWKSFSIDTSEFKGSRATVLFQTSTPRDAMRHFCWRARVMSDGGKTAPRAPSDAGKKQSDGEVGSVQPSEEAR